MAFDDSSRKMRSPADSRSTAGKLDILVIAVIALLLVAALLYVLFTIIGHSEEHVETVKKTKVFYNESLRWRPDSNLSEPRIRDDLVKNPDRMKADYSDLHLNEPCLRLIGKMSRLEQLKLTRSTLEDRWLKHIAHLPLQALSLHGASTGDKAVPYVLQMKDLKSLSIGDTDLTDKGMEQLSNSKTISHLQLNMTRYVTNNGIKYLSKMKQLELLEIENPKKVDGRCLAYIADLPELSTLNIEGMSLSAEDLRFLSKLKKLSLLNVSNSHLTDRKVAEIANLSTLHRLHFSGNDITDSGLVSMTRLKSLSSLSLKNCPNLHKEAVTKFKSMMPHCSVQYSQVSAIAEELSGKGIERDLEFLEREVNEELKKIQTAD